MKDYNSNQIYNSLFNFFKNDIDNNNNYNTINNNSNNKNNQIKINNFLKRLDYNIKNQKKKLEKLKQKFFKEKNYDNYNNNYNNNDNININNNYIYQKKRSFSQFFADQKRHADILEKKLNKMRTESDNKIKNTMKDRPNINSHSKKLSQNLNNDIIERLYHNNLYKTNKKNKNINKNNNNDNYNDNLSNNNNSNKKKFNPYLFENLYNDALLRKIRLRETYDDYYLEFDYPIKTPNLSNKILYNKFRIKFQNEINNTIFNHNKNTITFKEIKILFKNLGFFNNNNLNCDLNENEYKKVFEIYRNLIIEDINLNDMNNINIYQTLPEVNVDHLYIFCLSILGLLTFFIMISYNNNVNNINEYENNMNDNEENHNNYYNGYNDEDNINSNENIINYNNNNEYDTNIINNNENNIENNNNENYYNNIDNNNNVYNNENDNNYINNNNYYFDDINNNNINSNNNDINCYYSKENNNNNYYINIDNNNNIINEFDYNTIINKNNIDMLDPYNNSILSQLNETLNNKIKIKKKFGGFDINNNYIITPAQSKIIFEYFKIFYENWKKNNIVYSNKYERKNFSFKPHLNSNNNNYNSEENLFNHIQKSKIKQLKCKEKILKMEKIIKDEEDKNCTFKPKINEFKKDDVINLNNFLSKINNINLEKIFDENNNNNDNNVKKTLIKNKKANNNNKSGLILIKNRLKKNNSCSSFNNIKTKKNFKLDKNSYLNIYSTKNNNFNNNMNDKSSSNRYINNSNSNIINKSMNNNSINSTNNSTKYINKNINYSSNNINTNLNSNNNNNKINKNKLKIQMNITLPNGNIKQLNIYENDNYRETIENFSKLNDIDIDNKIKLLQIIEKELITK